MKFKTMLRLLVIGLILLGLAACTPAAPIPTLTPAPGTDDVLIIPVSGQVFPTSISLREEGRSPNYTITAQTPRLAGSNDARVKSFNEKVHKLVQGEIQYFRENILAQMPVTPITTGSYFDVQHALVFQHADIWAFKFNFTGYADGAAQPYHYSMTVNYDLEQDRKLSLDDLFLPDSNYLQAISSYSIAELSKRGIGFYGGFEKGAEPSADNYRNWNITQNGLMITFDEYQVAPYTAGAQIVTIPYSELNPIIKKQGALASLLP